MTLGWIFPEKRDSRIVESPVAILIPGPIEPHGRPQVSTKCMDTPVPVPLTVAGMPERFLILPTIPFFLAQSRRHDARCDITRIIAAAAR